METSADKKKRKRAEKSKERSREKSQEEIKDKSKSATDIANQEGWYDSPSPEKKLPLMEPSARFNLYRFGHFNGNVEPIKLLLLHAKVKDWKEITLTKEQYPVIADSIFKNMRLPTLVIIENGPNPKQTSYRSQGQTVRSSQRPSSRPGSAKDKSRPSSANRTGKGSKQNSKEQSISEISLNFNKNQDGNVVLSLASAIIRYLGVEYGYYEAEKWDDQFFNVVENLCDMIFQFYEDHTIDMLEFRPQTGPGSRMDKIVKFLHKISHYCETEYFPRRQMLQPVQSAKEGGQSDSVLDSERLEVGSHLETKAAMIPPNEVYTIADFCIIALYYHTCYNKITVSKETQEIMLNDCLKPFDRLDSFVEDKIKVTFEDHYFHCERRFI